MTGSPATGCSCAAAACRSGSRSARPRRGSGRRAGQDPRSFFPSMCGTMNSRAACLPSSLAPQLGGRSSRSGAFEVDLTAEPAGHGGVPCEGQRAAGEVERGRARLDHPTARGWGERAGSAPRPWAGGDPAARPAAGESVDVKVSALARPAPAPLVDACKCDPASPDGRQELRGPGGAGARHACLDVGPEVEQVRVATPAGRPLGHEREGVAQRGVARPGSWRQRE